VRKGKRVSDKNKYRFLEVWILKEKEMLACLTAQARCLR
jgi:hypothetical protein